MPTATADATGVARLNGATTRHDIPVTHVAARDATPVATTPRDTTPSRWGAIMTWALLIICAVASLLANVAGAKPSLIAKIFAGAPPVVFLACVEVILRAEVPRLIRYTWARFGGIIVVAAVSAYASYIHQVELLLSLGESAGIAYTLPAALDGAMLLASVTLVGLAEAKRTAHATRDNETTGVVSRDTTPPRDTVASTMTPVATRHDTTVATATPTATRQLSRDTTPKATRQPTTRDKPSDTTRLIADATKPGDTAPTVRDKLLETGHDINLRNIQRYLQKTRKGDTS